MALGASIACGLGLGIVGGGARPQQAAGAAPATVAALVHQASGRPVASGTTFSFCHRGGGTNCVVDGDTAWIAGEKVRLADIDAPETHPARCAEEAERGARATQRLQVLLSSGALSLVDNVPATDRYGRRLAVVSVAGRSVGETLVAEGLARRWEGYRRPWCESA